MKSTLMATLFVALFCHGPVSADDTEWVFQGELTVALETLQVSMTLWVELDHDSPRAMFDGPVRVVLDGRSTSDRGDQCWQIVIDHDAREVDARIGQAVLAPDGLLGVAISATRGTSGGEAYQDDLFVLVPATGDELDHRTAGLGYSRMDEFSRFDAEFIIQGGRLRYQVDRYEGDYRGARMVARTVWPVFEQPKPVALTSASMRAARWLNRLRDAYGLLPCAAAPYP